MLAAHPPTIIRDETRVLLSDAGAARPYVKTFDYEGSAINAFHQSLAAAPLGRMGVPFCIDLGIDGYLATAEAMKLYEIAFFCEGDILELGTFRGLSGSIIAHALSDRGSGYLETCDIDRASSKLAAKTVKPRPGGHRVRFHVADAAVLLDQLTAKKRMFGMAFVDHWHGYDATHAALIRMKALLLPGGFVVLHDYNDPCSLIADHPHKVFQATRDTIDQDPEFRFVCVVASMGVYQRL